MIIKQKQIIDHIEKLYAVNILEIGGRLKLVAASEGVGPCRIYDYETLAAETVWEEPGGVMSIVPIPGRDGEFLATQKFFPVFDAEEAVVVHAVYDQKTSAWSVREVQYIPYLHRFDIIQIDSQLFFIGGVLCTGKEEVQDWSKPGKLIIGQIPDAIDGDWDLKTLHSGITKHHGYYLQRDKNRFFVSGCEGMFEVTIPETAAGQFAIEKVVDREISDMAVCDIDNDGEDEIATIEMFHGNELIINKLVDGIYRKVYSHPIDFGHVIWGGQLAGKPAFLVGSRRGKYSLDCITCSDGIFSVDELDKDIGPTQLVSFVQNSEVVALSANRQQEEVAIYKFFNEESV